MHVLYSGRVQGVGFRYTTRAVVSGFEITGMIRNLPDGRVEMLAEGCRDELTAFLQAIRDSGLGHFIAHEMVTWADATGEFKGFAIAS